MKEAKLGKTNTSLMCTKDLKVEDYLGRGKGPVVGKGAEERVIGGKYDQSKSYVNI